MKNAIIRDTLKVFAVGGVALLMAAAAGFFAFLAVMLFVEVTRCSGYAAVVRFSAALLTAAFSLLGIYTCGAWMVQRGKFSK